MLLVRLTVPIPLRCRHCGQTLGAIVDGELAIGAVRFRRAVSFRCPCGKWRKWTPDEKSTR